VPELVTNGVRLHYEDYGAGAPVVLAHGLGGTAADIWKKVIAPLAEEFRVVAYDLRGSGTSDVPAGQYSVEQLADDLARVVDHLELGRVGLIGHSLGGGIALQYAATRPGNVAAVVGVGAVCRLPEQGREAMETRAQTVEAEGMVNVAVTVATNGLDVTFREAHPDELQEFISLLASNDPTGYAAQCRALVAMDVAARLGDVSAPVLLVGGDHDLASPPAMNQENAARLATAEVLELPDCAHIVPWEKPGELLDAARSFLRQHL
jgi:3-oxoadipate enol-lactonase